MEQVTLDMGMATLAVPESRVEAQAVPEERPPVALRQLELPMTASSPPPGGLFDRVLPRLFHRGSRNGRELRDGVLLSGAPRITGPDQVSFRQRRADGQWRLVTIFTFGVIKSITEWTHYLPQHHEAET